MRTAVFAGGCFWCITPVFAEHPGVLSVRCGYCGGREAAPSYEDVKGQRTGHRESLRIDYDENAVSYEELLRLFLESVDPFDGEGQFIDRGRSYSPAVYYADEAEHAAVRKALSELEQRAGVPAAVAAEPLGPFYEAEEHHQDYYKKNPDAFAEELRISGRLKRR